MSFRSELDKSIKPLRSNARTGRLNLLERPFLICLEGFQSTVRLVRRVTPCNSFHKYPVWHWKTRMPLSLRRLRTGHQISPGLPRISRYGTWSTLLQFGHGVIRDFSWIRIRNMRQTSGHSYWINLSSELRVFVVPLTINPCDTTSSMFGPPWRSRSKLVVISFSTVDCRVHMIASTKGCQWRNSRSSRASEKSKILLFHSCTVVEQCLKATTENLHCDQEERQYWKSNTPQNVKRRKLKMHVLTNLCVLKFFSYPINDALSVMD